MAEHCNGLRKKRKEVTMRTQSRQRWINVALVVAVLVVLGVTAQIYFSQCGTFDCPNVAEFVRGFGPWSPLAYAALYIASSPVPSLGTVLSATGGLLFGPGLGTLYATTVATVSSLVPFFLARRLGHDWVESRMRGKRLEEIYRQSSGSNGFIFVLLMRLIPILSWEVQSYVAGLIHVSVPAFILATMIGIIPGTFFHVLLGSSVADLTSWEFYVAVAPNGIMILVPVVVIYVRNRRSKG